MRPHYRVRQALRLVLPIAAAALATLPLAAEPNRAAIAYHNQKYGFALSIPGDVFVPAEAKNPEEGGLWQSRDGQARLLAVAGTSAAGTSLSSYRTFVMQQTYKDAAFDYTPVRDNWFVLSGRLNDRLFYERITFTCEGRYIYGWQLNYPVAEKQRYDRIVEAIHRSYRPGRGEDGRCGRQARDQGRDPS